MDYLEYLRKEKPINKRVQNITESDKKEIEETLNAAFYYEDFTISLNINEKGVSLSLEHDDSLYTEVHFKIFYKARKLLKEYGYKIK